MYSDPDDPEYIRQMRRPAEVKEDVKQMEQRSRVSLILKSQAFKEELEQLIQEQLAAGNHPASLLALQQISELLPKYGFNQSTGGGGAFSGMLSLHTFLISWLMIYVITLAIISYSISTFC